MLYFSPLLLNILLFFIFKFLKSILSSVIILLCLNYKHFYLIIFTRKRCYLCGFTESIPDNELVLTTISLDTNID